MCGICGAFSLKGELDPAVKAALPRMTSAVAHRGPEGEAYHYDRRVALGHRRLAIIDRAGGVQPMQNEDGSCWIVFNGEIYNHRDLRRRLIGLGHLFRTASDTETILHAYEQFGTDCLEQLEGMFAFAIYDARAGTLFLGRDRIGKKPLYYSVVKGVFHFASEIKALAESPYWNDTTNLDALEGYLSLGYFIAPETLFQDVKQLQPAHWLLVKNGQVAVREYWDIPAMGDSTASEEAQLGELDHVLGTAVRDRLETEVQPLGAFLSGGIDSGLIVSYMSEAQQAPAVTISVGFENAAHNELEWSAMTAERYRSVHHARLVQPRLDEVMEPLTGAFDEPFADSSAVPTYYLCRAAREHVTVALSGDGGDEAFAGYDFRYQPERIEGWIRDAAPAPVRIGAARALARLWPRSRHLPRALRLGNIFDNLAAPAEDAYYADLCFLKPGAARTLLGQPPKPDPRDSPVFETVVAPFRRWPKASLLQRIQYADLKVYLPSAPLVKVDRLSMWHGLEIRCPLLDRRVIEWAFRVPTHRMMPGLRAKHLLRALARRRLPAPVSRLPKRGFTAPVGAWLAQGFASPFRDEVLRPGSFVDTICDRRQVRVLFEENRTKAADHGYALWALWMLERWRTKYAKRKAA